jgi:ketosteroid isomerase-like protein
MRTTYVETDIPAAVARFLDALETGRWDGFHECLSPDVVYDASVPGWHYQYEGAARVAQEYEHEWTGKHAWHVIERHVSPTADGVVVDFEARGRCPGDDSHGPHEEAVRIANIFRLEDGRIAEHRFYCCGEWDEETLRRIELEASKIERREEDR